MRLQLGMTPRELAIRLPFMADEPIDKDWKCHVELARDQELIEVQKFRWELRACTGMGAAEREELKHDDAVEMNRLWAREDRRT